MMLGSHLSTWTFLTPSRSCEFAPLTISCKVRYESSPFPPPGVVEPPRTRVKLPHRLCFLCSTVVGQYGGGGKLTLWKFFPSMMGKKSVGVPLFSYKHELLVHMHTCVGGSWLLTVCRVQPHSNGHFLQLAKMMNVWLWWWSSAHCK